MVFALPGPSSTVLWAGQRDASAFPPYTWSEPEIVLAGAVRELITAALTVALAEALRSEVHARVLASDKARNACDKRMRELRELWRVRRQERITSELLEVVAGRLAV